MASLWTIPIRHVSLGFVQNKPFPYLYHEICIVKIAKLQFYITSFVNKIQMIFTPPNIDEIPAKWPGSLLFVGSSLSVSACRHQSRSPAPQRVMRRKTRMQFGTTEP